MKYLSGLFFFIFFVCSIGRAQEVVYPVTNYTTKDYGLNFNSQKWSVVQDNRGIIYIGTESNLLEFDGHSWNSSPINKMAYILSLATDASGILYAGSQNEFGYFAPDRKTGLKYYSLSDSLDINDTEFSNIRYVNVFSGGVAFQAEEKLFIYTNGKINVINPVTKFHTSFVVNDLLFVRQKEVGLMVWKDGKLNKIEGSEIFKATGIFLMLPFGSGGKKILIGTQEIGFWIFDPSSENKFRPFILKKQTLIDNAEISGGVLMSDGLIALSTFRNGIILINTNGEIVTIINKGTGLLDNDVKQVIVDKSQNLWLALQNGISTIEYSSPISFYTEKSGIEGSVQCVIRHKGLLYVGTSTGLYVQNNKSERGTQFITAFNISSPVWSLIEVDGRLLAGTDVGILEINGTNIEKISTERSSTLYYSPAMKLLLSGASGISVFQKSSTFRKINLFEEIKSDIFSITGIEPENSDSCVIWAGSRANGIATRLVIHKDLRRTIDQYFGISDGLVDGPVYPFKYKDEIIFGTSEGFRKFKHESEVIKDLPDSLKNDPVWRKGMFYSYLVTRDTIGHSVSCFIDSPDRVWICADNHLGYINKNDTDNFINAPFRGIDAKINSIYPENNGICWFATTEGLIRYDLNSGKDYSADFLSLIRKVTATRTDSILFAGTNFITDSDKIKITTSQPDLFKPVLAYRNNSLRFDFAAPFYEYPDKMFFLCRLEGFDSTWTNLGHSFYYPYTNLHEGNYTFRVRAQNVYGHNSDEALYSFTVLPPWYRSWPAYIIYGILSLLTIWISARLYSLRLKRENIRLEGIVRDRTAEVVRQRDVLEHQNKEIEDSIRYASRIQNAVLPADHDFAGLIPESFVFFKPLEIVSGDFYWISQVESKLIISAADCTGHGVPGAFMSMLGVAFLNEIVNKDHVTRPDLILNKLRDKVIEALQQQGKSGEAKDGMDIVLVCIDEQTKKLSYAGAYNPLIMIRNGELSEISADKMPIAIYDNMKEFTMHEISIATGDLFYFYSDGYEDQFGGPNGKKLKSKRFKQLLLDNYDKPLKDQKLILEKSFEEWKGNLKQVDDIVVIGVKV
jgi:serine phosphatase RsbU (regulator of sigma subunit)